MFNGAPKTSGQDTIADFQHGLDHIALKVGPFANIGGVGPLLDSHFRVGTAATTADHGVIYNSATGNIYSDADGVGGAAAVLFAHVTVGTVLTAADFLVF